MVTPINPALVTSEGMYRVQRGKVTITSAELLALNATPKTLVAAPGAGFALIFLGMLVQKPAGTAYVEDAGDDLAVKYTDGSGLQVGLADSTGFLDQTTNQVRFIQPYHAASGVSSITPVANAPLVAQVISSELTTGDSDLNCEILYTIVDTAPAG